MALISITFDTKTKECKVLQDGVEMEEVRYVDIYKYGDETPSISIEQHGKENDGMNKTIRTVASQLKELSKVT